VALKKPSEVIKSNLSEDYNPLVASIGKFSEESTTKNSSNIFESFNSFKDNLDKIDILSEKIETFYGEISERITKKDFENAMLSQLMVIDESFSQIKSQIKGINKNDLFEFKETVRNIENIISNLIENDIPSYRKIIVNNEISFDNKIKTFQDKISTEVQEYYNIISELIVNINEKITDSVDETVNERIENYLRKHHSQVVDLKEEVLSKIDELPIGDFENNLRDLERKIRHIERVYGSINTDALVENVVKEGLLNEPPDVKNSDPLTPLDQNFVTQQELQTHYKLFLNRIQQQMATIGGGGETRLKYLDDIVGIATNASAYDNKFLKYNHGIGKFEFVTGSGSGGGESFWSQSGVGIVTTTNVGINTTNPTSALTVYGDALIVGIVTATDFNSASDIKLKENVSVIDNPLDKILKLEGVNFQWKETGKKSLGVIAQEVEKVLPELVSGEESKTVNYNGIIGLLIECVKKQQEEINELKRLIDK
jgi:hypothetical protein